MVVMVDPLGNGFLQLPREVIVLQFDDVLHRPMITLYLALGLRVIRRATDMIHTLAVEPFSQIAGDVGRTIIAEQPRLVGDLGAIAA